MMIKFVRFNIYLCVAISLLLATGCQTQRKKKDLTTIELHLEVNRDGGEDNAVVPVLRDHPMMVNVDQTAFVDGVDLVEASLVDDMGGFKLRLKFNWRGTQLLNSITSANPGKRIAVNCNFGESRWLGAPLIRKPLTDGVLTFTPDASREEVEKIVKGLNNVVAEMKKKDKF